MEGLHKSLALEVLEEQLAKRGHFGGVRNISPMWPIYQALMELDQAGVKVRTSVNKRDVVRFDASSMDMMRPLELTLWNLETNMSNMISLKAESMQGVGAYVGEVEIWRNDGFRRRVQATLGSEEFKDAASAIAWLMAKIAPCVVSAPGLVLNESRSDKVREEIERRNREREKREGRIYEHEDNGRLVEYESGVYQITGLPLHAEVRWLTHEVVSSEGQRLGSIFDFMKEVELDVDKEI